MAKSWQELKRELEEETRKLMATPPDEIKRFHYGIITHSEAGKYNLNQYFGHFVEAYDLFSTFTVFLPPWIRYLATDPDFELKHVKKMFCDAIAGSAGMFAEYGASKTVVKYANEMVEALDSVQTKEEFIELLEMFNLYVGRLYAWIHWYFPWGLGPVGFQRRSLEDLKEMIRLSETS